MSNEIELKCFALMEEHEIEMSELPEKIQRKFEQLESLIEEFEECEQDSDEEQECELRMEAMDTGITTLLEEFIEKRVVETENHHHQNKQQAAQGGQVQPQTSETPSWRFWM